MDFYSEHSVVHLVSAMKHPPQKKDKIAATPFFLFMYIYVYMWLVRLWKFIFMTYMFEVIKLLYTCGPCRISSFSLFLYFFPFHAIYPFSSKNEDYEDKEDSDGNTENTYRMYTKLNGKHKTYI